MDREALIAMLDEALLTPEELATPEAEWADRFPDPFPEWNMGIDAIGSEDSGGSNAPDAPGGESELELEPAAVGDR